MQQSAIREVTGNKRFSEDEVTDLVGRIAARETKAFEVLYTGFRPSMIANASRWLANDVPAAEDAVEEAFCDIWQKAGCFAGNGSAIGWIRRIVKNKAIDQVRRQSRLVCVEHHDFMHIEAELADGPEAAALAGQQRDRVAQAIEQLSPSHREVISLFYFSELSVDDIAARLDAPKGTVKSRLYHARQYLMAVFHGEQDNVPDQVFSETLQLLQSAYCKLSKIK